MWDEHAELRAKSCSRRNEGDEGFHGRRSQHVSLEILLLLLCVVGRIVRICLWYARHNYSNFPPPEAD